MAGSPCGQVGDGREPLRASRRCLYLLSIEFGRGVPRLPANLTERYFASSFRAQSRPRRERILSQLNGIFQITRPRGLTAFPRHMQKTESTKLSVFLILYSVILSIRYSVFSITTTVSSTIVSASSASSSSSEITSLSASVLYSIPLRLAISFLKSFEKKNPAAIITANTIR